MWLVTAEGTHIDEAAPFFNEEWFNSVEEGWIMEGDVISADGTINLHVAAAPYKPEWSSDTSKFFFDPDTYVEYVFQIDEEGNRSLRIDI